MKTTIYILNNDHNIPLVGITYSCTKHVTSKMSEEDEMTGWHTSPSKYQGTMIINDEDMDKVADGIADICFTNEFNEEYFLRLNNFKVINRSKAYSMDDKDEASFTFTATE